ncbi:MAG: flagellar hook protein, partial [Acetatifactor sp.]|nr:flagellar hook protein [Acetatifactor sp.]
HNLTAMNSSRMLGLTTSSQAKSTEKLSSGYKINRAADDAAGLSISEKMRKQIRGLTQASANAQDGISAVQTAEGALNEVQDMLQRMNELAVKAANGTNSENDRNYIQNEIDQLTTEIDRVAQTTKFNEAYLLKGDQSVSKVAVYTYKNYEKATAATVTDAKGSSTISDQNTGLSMKVSFNSAAAQATQNTLASALKSQGVSLTGVATATTVAGTGGSAGTSFKTSVGYALSLNGSAASQFKVIVDATDNTKFTIQDLNGNKIATVTVSGISDEDEATLTKGGTSYKESAVLTATNATAAFGEGEVAAYYDRDGNKISANALDSYFAYDSINNKEVARVDAADVYDALGNKIELKASVVSGTESLTGALNLTLHVGADATSDNQINMNLNAMTTKGLGINGLKVNGTDSTNALSAIETIKEAIQKVSTQRSALGAIQNRLEHTISNLDNVVENTTAAESQIRDTDMADEMVKYSNNNILSQAGQAMLAQANQSNQGVLSLLG